MLFSQQVQTDANRLIINSNVPLFEQQLVHTAMVKFHSALAELALNTCSLCSESFPNLTMAPHSTECSRCSRCKLIPRLYSPANNMDPGPLPAQLQVYLYN